VTTTRIEGRAIDHLLSAGPRLTVGMITADLGHLADLVHLQRRAVPGQPLVQDGSDLVCTDGDVCHRRSSP